MFGTGAWIYPKDRSICINSFVHAAIFWRGGDRDKPASDIRSSFVQKRGPRRLGSVRPPQRKTKTHTNYL